MHAPRTLQQCWDWAKALIDSADAELLMLYSFGRSFTELFTRGDCEVSEDDRDSFQTYVVRRQTGEPVAYITQNKQFRELNLKITPCVLTPRFETELIVDVVLELVCEGDRVLDLGTGSGAIALSLKAERKLNLVASDFDPDALNLCRENAKRHCLEIETVLSDWFTNVQEKFDVIVSNPPYVARQDSHLQQGDLRFEPTIALVGGESGLECLMTIIEASPNHLNPGGWLVVEHGYDQRDKVVKLFQNRGFKDVKYRSDYANIPRFVWGQSRG